MTLIFIMTSEVTAQGQATKKYARGPCFFFFFFFFAIFLQCFPSFSLFVSLFLFSFFIWAFISYFCSGLAYSLRQAGLLKKDKVKVDFQNSSNCTTEVPA